VKDDDLPIVCFLVELYSEAQRLKDTYGETPLGVACKCCYSQRATVIRYLVQECPVVLEPDDDSVTSTPLHRLCRESSSDLLDILVILATSKKAVLCIG